MSQNKVDASEQKKDFAPSPITTLVPDGSISKGWFYFVFAVLLAVITAAHSIYQFRTSIKYETLLLLANPALLGTLSLLLGLLSRNSGISDRIRSLGSELNKIVQEDTPISRISNRVESIRKQLRDFRIRYLLNVYSLMAICFNLIIMPAIVLTFPMLPTTEAKVAIAMSSGTTIETSTLSLLMLSSALFVFAAVSCIIDIWLSIVTIEADLFHSFETANKLAESPEKIDDEVFETIVHFSTLFHSIWYNERLSVLRQLQKDPDKTGELEDVIAKYFGLQHEEFHFFLNNLLPDRLYLQWLVFLRNQSLEFRQEPNGPMVTEKKVGPLSLVGWWNVNRAQFNDERFIEAMDQLLVVKCKSDEGSYRPFSVTEIGEWIRKQRETLKP
jgi:hypothetical protein